MNFWKADIRSVIIRDIFHERISDSIRSVTISGKSVLIRDNKLVRIIRSAPVHVIVKAQNPLRNNPWVFASTDIRSAPLRTVSFSKKKSAPRIGFQSVHIPVFLFLAPYARTTRYEEAFLPEGKKRPHYNIFSRAELSSSHHRTSLTAV